MPLFPQGYALNPLPPLGVDQFSIAEWLSFRLPLPNQSMLFLGTVGATGMVQANIPMRDIPPFYHVRLHLMAASVSPFGARFSNPMKPVLLDASW